jgi:hypothetical protein
VSEVDFAGPSLVGTVADVIVDDALGRAGFRCVDNVQHWIKRRMRSIAKSVSSGFDSEESDKVRIKRGKL